MVFKIFDFRARARRQLHVLFSALGLVLLVYRLYYALPVLKTYAPGSIIIYATLRIYTDIHDLLLQHTPVTLQRI